MPSDRIAYPWFFFYRVARLLLAIFLPALLVMIFFFRSSYQQGLKKEVRLQAMDELKSLEHALEGRGIKGQSLCGKLPLSLDGRLRLLKRDGTDACGQVVPTLEGITADLELSSGFLLRKTVPKSTFRQSMEDMDDMLFFRIVPLALACYALFILLFYVSTKPLGVILSKVKKYKDDIPFNKNIRLLYQRDEWAAIVEALNKTDEKLKEQAKAAQEQNITSSVILESINDNIIAVDRFETILFYNTKFKKDFLKEDAASQLQPKLWHTFSDDLLLRSFKSVLINGKAISLRRMNFPESRSSHRFFDITITALTSSEGSITGALGVFYDVTEFKLSEQMRVDFVANVSHEIRTPLTSIKGYTQILQNHSDKIDGSLHEFLGKILGNTERMISLFNDLLNLSVLESRNLHAFEDLDLTEMVETVAENIQTHYPEKNILVSTDLALGSIKGDSRLMEQVLSNLMDNACKYSAGHDISIRITSEKKGDKGLLTVSDNGPGISKEHLDRIFERFYRVDTSREISRGTGLGLSIVKHIINKHRGRIWAESDGRGTTFFIELPLEQVL